MSPKKKSPTVNIEEIREQLVDQREKILQSVKQHHVASQDMVRGDLVDQSTDLSERELILGLAEGDRVKLQRIETALQMMDNNTYGICQECEESIPVKRLLAMPTARYCVSCKEQLERTGEVR